jgi:hypothetical protein
VKELAVPPSVASARQAVEMARIWHADGKQIVALHAPGWKDPAAWGLLLVDLAKLVANAYAQAEGRNESEVLARIKAGFDAEWGSPTNEPKGRFLK